MCEHLHRSSNMARTFKTEAAWDAVREAENGEGFSELVQTIGVENGG